MGSMKLSSPPNVLVEAALDFYLLLNRGYPRGSALQWVGNRYGLARPDRDILERGVFNQSEALRRRSKKAKGSRWRRLPLFVDGHNVHITVESALRERALLVGNDGALRDIASVSRAFRPDSVSEEALGMICCFLGKFPGREIHFYFDAPMSRSGELAHRYRSEMKRWGIGGTARAVPVPERLFPSRGGVVASSDRIVIDKSEHWIDLARRVIDYFRIAVPAYDFSLLLDPSRVTSCFSLGAVVGRALPSGMQAPWTLG